MVPRFLHERTGQPRSCLRGLVTYAGKVAANRLTGRFESAKDVRDWIWGQPILLDNDGNERYGAGLRAGAALAHLAQVGLECWEATGALARVASAETRSDRVHLFDLRAYADSATSFPAATYLDDSEPPRRSCCNRPYGRGSARRRGPASRSWRRRGPLPPPPPARAKCLFFIDLDPGPPSSPRSAGMLKPPIGALPDTVLNVFRLRGATGSFSVAYGRRDLLFLIVERPFFLAEATALSSGSASRSAGGRNPAVPAAARPAALCRGRRRPIVGMGRRWDTRWITPAASTARANAVENDVLGAFTSLAIGAPRLRPGLGLDRWPWRRRRASGLCALNEQRKARQ